jgi:hypothetical protein
MAFLSRPGHQERRLLDRRSLSLLERKLSGRIPVLAAIAELSGRQAVSQPHHFVSAP